MARPKYRAGDITARERLVNAFFDTLEHKRYSTITVGDIATAAGVNRNTFYYHFDSMTELAAEAVSKALYTPEFMRMVISHLETDPGATTGMLHSPEMQARLRAIRLIVGPNGDDCLRNMLKDNLRDIACTTFGIDCEQLQFEDKAALEFLVGGLASLLSFWSAVEPAKPFDGFDWSLASRLREDLEFISLRQQGEARSKEIGQIVE